MNNADYLKLFQAFHAVGDLKKEDMIGLNRNRVVESYHKIKDVLKEGHATIGDAMIARGLRGEADFN